MAIEPTPMARPSGIFPLDAETRVAERPRDHHAEIRLWLRLLTCTTLIEGEIRRRLREQFDVTLPRFDLMAQLHKSPSGLTLGDLSARMMVTAGNTTALVDRLTGLGLIERQPSPRDRRASYVRLTPAGEAEFERLAAAHGDWLAEMFDGLDGASIEGLMQGLARAKHSVRAALDTRPVADAGRT